MAGLLQWLFEKSAACPEAPALEQGARSITYRTLLNAGPRVAQLIAGRNPGLNGPLAIVAANCPEYVAALFGGLFSRRPIAELSPLESPEKLLGPLATLRPAALFTTLDPSPFSPLSCPVISPEEIEPFLRTPSKEPLHDFPAGDSDEVAFIVFTSGTTGAPKGVMLSHANLQAVGGAILDYLPLEPTDRYSLILPLFHTYGLSVLLTTLRTGGCVVFDDGFQDLPAFTRRLAENRITVFSGVPYHINLLLRRAPLASYDFSSLRLVTISGSHLAPESLCDIAGRLPGARVFFMYGLTESSTRACVLPPERIPDKPGSVGLPIRGVEVSIAGEEGQILAPGQVGEVRLRGPNIMRGYFKDPDLTAFALRGGWLHTGDLGFRDEDGFLFLVGRKNDLIKCAGERISAMEIEEVLSSHPGVLEATVAGVHHPVLGEAVQAWVVPRDPLLTEEELRAYCAKRLTHHKIPRTWVFLGSLPRTPSGKIQKYRLPLEPEAREG